MERLKVLAAAAGLGAFTAADLAAYAGVSENTVRSVLRRDAAFFTAGEPVARNGRGRPRHTFTVADIEAIHAEVREMESAVGTLTGAYGMTPQPDPEGERADLVAVAEQTIVRAWDSDDGGERRVLADTALLNLDALGPPPEPWTAAGPPSVPIVTFGTHQTAGLPHAPAHSVLIRATAARHWHAGVHHSAAAEADHADIFARAQHLSVLAGLTADTADGHAIGVPDLTRAAAAVAALSRSAPPERLHRLLGGLVMFAIAGDRLPPLGLVTRSGRTPGEVIDGVDNDDWYARALPGTGDVVWAQKWARKLARMRLYACNVLDDTVGRPEAIDITLNRVARLSALSKPMVPRIVVSTRPAPYLINTVARSGAMLLTDDARPADLSGAIGASFDVSDLSRV